MNKENPAASGLSKMLDTIFGKQECPKPNFLSEEELTDLETDLPALARVLRDHQVEITRISLRINASSRAGRIRKTIVFIALLLLASWFFRYAPAGEGGVILDRWTGDVVMPVVYKRRSLGDIPVEK